MKIDVLQTGSYAVNTAVVRMDDGRVFAIDPGADGGRVAAALEKAGAEDGKTDVLLTHGHFDHIGAVASVQSRFPSARVFIHPADVPMLAHPMNQNPPDYPLAAMPANIADARSVPGVETIETPGHTPGGVCYFFRDANILFSGDTLFAGSAGRTDFPGGSMSQLVRSLARLMQLDDSVKTVPGHGPFTTIGRERASNPFLV